MLRPSRVCRLALFFALSFAVVFWLLFSQLESDAQRSAAQLQEQGDLDHLLWNGNNRNIIHPRPPKAKKPKDHHRKDPPHTAVGHLTHNISSRFQDWRATSSGSVLFPKPAPPSPRSVLQATQRPAPAFTLNPITPYSVVTQPRATLQYYSSHASLASNAIIGNQPAPPTPAPATTISTTTKPTSTTLPRLTFSSTVARALSSFASNPQSPSTPSSTRPPIGPLPNLVFYPKTWWAAGLNARDHPGVLIAAQASEAVVLRWSARASEMFAARWAAIQHVDLSRPATDALTCNLTTADAFVELPCADWGLLSVMRDVETVFMEALLRNKTVVQRPDLAGQCRVYCSAEEGRGRDTHLGCFFHKFSQCGSPYGPGHPSALDRDPKAGMALDHSNVPTADWWGAWTQSGDVWWETTSGQRTALAPHATVAAYANFTMIRSLASTLLWRPVPTVVAALALLEKSIGVAMEPSSIQHPVLVIHARRTDKAFDAGFTSFVRTKYADLQLPVSEYGKMARSMEDNIGVSFRTVFIMSDDLGLWDKRAELVSNLRNPSEVKVFINPIWVKLRALLEHDLWKRWGHALLDQNRVGVSSFLFHANLLADILFAGKHADYLLGCGSSGVSQFIAQLMGSRLAMDPSWRTLWEEDYLLLEMVKERVAQRMKALKA